MRQPSGSRQTRKSNLALWSGHPKARGAVSVDDESGDEGDPLGGGGQAESPDGLVEYKHLLLRLTLLNSLPTRAVAQELRDPVSELYKDWQSRC